MSEIGIISNPHAKLNRRKPKRQMLLSYIAGEKGIYESTQTLEHLREAIQRFKDKGVKIIAINGGDGTISRTITAIIQEYGEHPLPKLTILRGGTVNMLATNLGIRGKPETILYRLMYKHSSDIEMKSHKLDTLEIDSNYGFLFGNGAVSTFLDVFYENKTNSLGAVLLVLRALLSRFIGKTLYNRIIKEHKIHLEVDASSHQEAKGIGVLAATVQRMPLGPKFFPKSGKGDGKMQCVVMTTTIKNTVWRLPIATLINPGKSNKDKYSFCCRNVKITCDSMANYTLDGELFDIISGNTQINVGPKIEFVIP